MRRRHALRIFIAIVGFIVPPLTMSTGAYADHYYARYPNRGFYWMSPARNYSGNIWVSSTNCNAQEVSAFAKVKNSTAGIGWMAWWPNGYNMQQVYCDGSLSNGTDIVIQYSDFKVTHGGGTYGGENHSTLAPVEYCASFGASYPCGSHPSTVHINLPKWNGTSTAGRERLIMHETGHSNGLANHCNGDSIMNDGTSGCNGGRWLQVMGYLETDRYGVAKIYAIAA